MPFTIERNDMAHVAADAIVITANEGLQINGGVGLAVARAAGLPQMQAACDALGWCPTGHAVATPAFALSADHVIHVVGPVWQGGSQDEEALLRQAYDNALACADECGARSIALPLVSAHTFGFPVRLSFVIAVEAIKAFLEDHDDTQVRLVLYGDDALAVGLSFYENIAQYIDSHYVEERLPRANARRNYPYADELPMQAQPQPRANREAKRQAQSLSQPRGYSEARKPARPPRQAKPPKGRRSPLGIVGAIVDGAHDLVSDLRERAQDEAAKESYVVRDEAVYDKAEVAEGSLGTEQYWRTEEEAEAVSRRAEICPYCGALLEGKRYCPECGHLTPSETSSDVQAAYSARPEAAAQSEARWGFGYEASTSSAPKADSTMGFGAASVGGSAQGGLSAWLDQLDAPFSTTLLALIDERGLTDAQVYKRANMSRQLFSKIRSDAAYRPTKKTVLALAIALGLDLGETSDLLRRAGFALSHSSKADVIVEYFISNGNYDIFDINEALFTFDQPLL